MVVRGISISGGFDKQLYRPGEEATLSFTISRGRTGFAVDAWAIQLYGQAASPAIFFEDAKPLGQSFIGPDNAQYSWTVKTPALPVGVGGTEGPIKALVCLRVFDGTTGAFVDPAAVGTPCPREDLKFTHVYATEDSAVVSSVAAIPAAAVDCSQIAALTVRCTAKVVGGSTPYAYDWHFGDNSGGPGGETAEHTYVREGEYTITLRVTDGTGLVAADWTKLPISGDGDDEIVDDDPPDPPCAGAGCDGGDRPAGIPVYVWVGAGAAAFVGILFLVRRRLF